MLEVLLRPPPTGHRADSQVPASEPPSECLTALGSRRPRSGVVYSFQGADTHPAFSKPLRDV